MRLTVNGRVHDLDPAGAFTLLELLRGRLALTGTKIACGHGECGACTVQLDGEVVYSCLTLAAACDGANVVTVEGLASGLAPGGSEPSLSPLQRAFIEKDAAQCGFCTPGQLVAAHTLLELLRGRLALSGTKIACGHGECGACTVQLDGEVVYSCLTLAAACEGDWSLENLNVVGERIWNLERQFNLAAGFTAADDNLPPRLLKEAAKTGPAKGLVNGLPKMLPEYYQAHGWTTDGRPSNETLARLGL